MLVYAVDSASPHQSACRAWLEDRRVRHDAWYITWNIVYEFLPVTTHPKVLRKPWSLAAAWKFIDALRASPGLGLLVPTDRHADVAAEVIRELPETSGNLIYDMHTAVLMREHGIARICHARYRLSSLHFSRRGRSASCTKRSAKTARSSNTRAPDTRGCANESDFLVETNRGGWNIELFGNFTDLHCGCSRDCTIYEVLRRAAALRRQRPRRCRRFPLRRSD